METSNVFQSKASYVLESIAIVVKIILVNLNNSDLIKCKYVCRLWKEIADLILSERIIIIKRKIPFNISKTAIRSPKLLQPFFDLKPNFQFVGEYSQFYIEDRNFLGEAINFVPVHSVRRDKIFMIHYNERMHSCQPLPYKGMIETRFAVFPSLPGINIQRFSFSTRQIKPSNHKTFSLTETLGVPEKDIKCALWFMNSAIKNTHSFPYLTVPSIVLSSLKDNYERFNPTHHCGIAFIGNRINASILQIHNETTFKPVKLNFTKDADILNKPEFDQSKCVAFFFSQTRCRCMSENKVLSSFKKTFPNVAVLFFNDIYVVDLRMPPSDAKDAAEQKLQFVRHTRDVLILLLYIE